MYTCTLEAIGHIWTIGHGGPERSVLIGTPLYSPIPEGAYTLHRIPSPENSTGNYIVSTLSVRAFDGLNGTQINCRDGGVQEELANRQEIVARVLGETILLQNWGKALFRETGGKISVCMHIGLPPPTVPTPVHPVVNGYVAMSEPTSSAH